jgi:hypothetical protein
MKLLTAVCQAQQLQDDILGACVQMHPPAAALRRLASASNAALQDAAGAPGCLEALHAGFAALFPSAGASHQHTAAAAAAPASAPAVAASAAAAAGSSMPQRAAGSATSEVHGEPASREPRGWPASNRVTLPEAAFIRRTCVVGTAGEAAAMQLHIRGCRVLAVDTEAFMQPSDARRHTLSLVQIGAPAAGAHAAPSSSGCAAGTAAGTVRRWRRAAGCWPAAWVLWRWCRAASCAGCCAAAWCVVGPCCADAFPQQRCRWPSADVVPTAVCGVGGTCKHHSRALCATTARTLHCWRSGGGAGRPDE